MIETKNLTKRYKNVTALDNLNLSIAKGEILGYIGPNGAGKSTTIRILAGLLRPTSGTATVNGLDVVRKVDDVKRLIGYLPDFYGVYDGMRVWEYLDFFAAAYGVRKRRRGELIERVLETTVAQEYRDYYMGTLSRGMRQKVGIARTLVNDPLVLLLDEPASGLDPQARIELRGLLRRLQSLGKTILISSHILSELAACCDRVAMIGKGKLLAVGKVDDISREVREHRIIEVELMDDASRAREALRHYPAVKSIHTFDNLLRIEFGGARDSIPAMLKHLIAGGMEVLWFREVEANLEETFMAITEREKNGSKKGSGLES